MTAPTAPMDGRLGRRFAELHPGNRQYGVRPLLTGLGEVERKPTFWALPAGPYPLDQGNEGACTGFGMAHELAAGPIIVSGVDYAYAMARYRRNQEEDRAMGYNFTDGATVLGTMKAAKADGTITQYRWCFGVDDVADTVCAVGPVCLGIEWTSSMYHTGPGGLVTVTGGAVGGHFITILGYDVHPQWGPCVLWLNSWGRDYGVAEPRLNAPAGIGWLPLPRLAYLLSRQGEAVVPADFFAAPTPPPVDTVKFFATRTSGVFHTARHLLIKHDRTFTSYQAAVDAGLRPCKLCRPKPTQTVGVAWPNSEQWSDVGRWE